MMICVNGNKRKVPHGITLEELVELFGLKKRSVVLELNRKVVDRASFTATRLVEDDAIEIVHFVGGG